MLCEYLLRDSDLSNIMQQCSFVDTINMVLSIAEFFSNVCGVGGDLTGMAIRVMVLSVDSGC